MTEDYLNCHVQHSGCKANEGQRTIYNWFQPVEQKEHYGEEEYNEEIEYDSDVYDNIDDDDLIQIDEIDKDSDQEFQAISMDELDYIQSNKKWLICVGLQSVEISKYIKRTPAQFGGCRRIEIVARRVGKVPSRKKLNFKQKRQLNCALFAESVWQIDRSSNTVRAKTCTGFAEKGNIYTECSSIRYNQNLCNKIARPLLSSNNTKFTPKHYWDDNPLKRYLQNHDLRDIWNTLNNESKTQSENSWIILADKALKGAFNDAPIFTGLCEVMSDAIERKMKNKSNKNLKYSEEFTNFLVILGGISSRALDIFRQNLEAKFKRLLDTINYNGPIATMTDNTKLKLGLRYSSNLECIIGSVLSNKETKVNIYSDIPRIINKIKAEDRIAKSVHAYLLQVPLPAFPPIVIALIPNNGSDTADSILQLHKQLIIEIAPLLGLHILSLGSDGAITEFQAQQSISKIQTNEKLIVKEPTLNINFSCPIFDNIGPVIRIQDPKHAKKTARNAIMSGARLLTLDSVMFKNDVIKLDRQDDAAAYRTFCSSNFRKCLTTNNQVKTGIEEFAIYLFRTHIEILSQKYPDFISLNQNFLANQTFAIFTSLCESLVLLVKAHRKYYSQIPLLPWFHGSEPVEHFFGIARQLNSDFDFLDLIQMIPKISQYGKALRSEKLSFTKDKTILNRSIEDFSTLYNSDSVDLEFRYGSENNLDFELLLQQRQRHEAYTSRPLERKFNIKSVSTKFTMTIHPNKASHIVAYFSNNENPEQRLVKQPQIHTKELAQTNKHKSIKKQKFFIQIPNIENANISENFPLIKDNYIFVIYGNQLCKGKVIAVYFEAYNRHCFIDEAVTNLNDIVIE
ncbi:hypothetical protein C2G38_2219046 [Gigaspora rosea]|uniref:Uncharacterized protein n=1 Tax=Gigaspora rosea TaxID=44941 RepID=A0A397UE68_9GLOM|nr:hypothetical protein C2G38_2219046 [Gigaspora rosea]